MSAFDLDATLRHASQRLAKRPARADKGTSRLDPRVRAFLDRMLRGHERPPMKELLARLARYGHERGLATPARATVYHALARARAPRYRVAHLPQDAQDALYNLAPTSDVPGHQLAFYCFHYGNLRALSFAAGLPWLALYQADRMRGWRPGSHGLLRAVLKARGI